MDEVPVKRIPDNHSQHLIDAVTEYVNVFKQTATSHRSEVFANWA
jgi:hypothetical protein